MIVFELKDRLTYEIIKNVIYWVQNEDDKTDVHFISKNVGKKWIKFAFECGDEND